MNYKVEGANYSGKIFSYSLAEAVRDKMLAGSYGSGELETIRDNIKEIANVVGLLVEASAQGRSLTLDEVTNLISYGDKLIKVDD